MRLMSLMGCIVLALFVYWANGVRQGAVGCELFSIARWIGAAQVVAGIGAIALLILFAGGG